MFEKAIKRLREIDLGKIALEEFEGVKHIAFDLNTDDQLFKQGVDSKGQDLGDYAPFTVMIRNSRGLPVDRITLRFEGDFHEAWEGDFNHWPVIFGSRDPKTDELTFQFGDDIFGLTEENIDKLIKSGLKDAIREALKTQIQKKLSTI